MFTSEQAVCVSALTGLHHTVGLLWLPTPSFKGRTARWLWAQTSPMTIAVLEFGLFLVSERKAFLVDCPGIFPLELYWLALLPAWEKRLQIRRYQLTRDIVVPAREVYRWAMFWLRVRVCTWKPSTCWRQGSGLILTRSAVWCWWDTFPTSGSAFPDLHPGVMSVMLLTTARRWRLLCYYYGRVLPHHRFAVGRYTLHLILSRTCVDDLLLRRLLTSSVMSPDQRCEYLTWWYDWTDSGRRFRRKSLGFCWPLRLTAPHLRETAIVGSRQQTRTSLGPENVTLIVRYTRVLAVFPEEAGAFPLRRKRRFPERKWNQRR